MGTPRMCLVLSENWTMTSGRDLPALVRWAREAEDAGFDSVMISEHVVLGPSAGSAGVMPNPREYALPGNQDPATPWPSSLVLLSAIAAVTERIRLVASAVIAPLRHPLLLARELGSLDLVSGGRLVVQPTVSWLPEEYAALGVPFAAAGRPAGRAPPGVGGALAGHPRVVLRPALLVPRRVLRAEGVPAGGPGAVAGRVRDAPPHGRAHRRVRRRVQPAGRARRPRTCCGCGRRCWPRAATPGSWNSSAAPAPCSPTTTAWRTWARPWPRSRPRPRPGFTTFCVKPSQFTDDPGDVGRLCRDIISRVDGMLP